MGIRRTKAKVTVGSVAPYFTLPSQSLEKAFELTLRPFGRVEGVSFEDQVAFEGWIFGIMEEA